MAISLPDVRTCAIKERNSIRVGWTVLITILLVYVGTYFLFRLCFIEFRLTTPLDLLPVDANGNTTDPIGDFERMPSKFWDAFEDFTNFIFWIDLASNFFFSYRDGTNREVLDIRKTASNYLWGSFCINLIACIPPDAIKLLFSSFIGGAPENLNQGLRVARLQRVSRLARLVRVTRLAKLGSQSKKMVKWFEKHKGARIINLGFGLLWLVHILACGWYLCAALHSDPRETWVARRVVDNAGDTLITRYASEQWFHAMYFVFTVFTTVGFGDMSAVTQGEMVYVCGLMIIGVVYHSIIMSQVINTVTSNDHTNEFVMQQRDLIDAFSDQTELKAASREEMTKWIYACAKNWMGQEYSKSDMKKLIMGKNMPRQLLGSVPQNLFQGKLVQNSLLTICQGICNTPPRLPLLLALALVRTDFQRKEVVYEENDYPFNLFLVYSGVFAFCTTSTATPARSSRITKSDAAEFHPYMLFAPGSYFGDMECIDSSPRRATAMCMSARGALLSFSTEEFKELIIEFPEFGAQWRRAATNREWLRVNKLAGIRFGVHYKDLASMTIQKWFRARERRRVRSPSRRDLSLPRNVVKEVCKVHTASPSECARTDMHKDLLALDRKLTCKIDMLAEQVSMLVALHGRPAPAAAAEQVISCSGKAPGEAPCERAATVLLELPRRLDLPRRFGQDPPHAHGGYQGAVLPVMLPGSVAEPAVTSPNMQDPPYPQGSPKGLALPVMLPGSVPEPAATPPNLQELLDTLGESLA